MYNINILIINKLFMIQKIQVDEEELKKKLTPEQYKILREKGMIISGISEDETLTEIIELPKEKHPFFIAGQFHPEFLARPLSPHLILFPKLLLFIFSF
jgi:CTP synthase